MLPRILDILGSIPSPAQIGWAWWCVTTGSEVQSQSKNSPRHRRSWFVGGRSCFVCFVSNNVIGNVYFTTMKQKKESLFLRSQGILAFLFITPAIAFDSVPVGSHMTSDILRKGLILYVQLGCLVPRHN